ncbi:MAG: TspO/MBR family protein [archaeon]
MNKFFRLISSIGICILAGVIGSMFTSSSVKTWYPSLIKPAIAPPNFLFPIVWTGLYILIGISLFLIWNTELRTPLKRISIVVFFLQLIVNILWSALFFAQKNIFYAFIAIIVLDILIILNIILFSRISKHASYLLIPYLLWVLFASVLNYYFLILN